MSLISVHPSVHSHILGLCGKFWCRTTLCGKVGLCALALRPTLEFRVDTGYDATVSVNTVFL